MDRGSHPNNVGRIFNPMETKSSGLAGIGGNLLWDDARMLFNLRFVLIGDVPLREVVSLHRRASQGRTHLGQLSSVSALQDVGVLKSSGRIACSPSIRREDKVDIPGVYEQWPEGDVFEV